jgi:hypothetical protein
MIQSNKGGLRIPGIGIGDDNDISDLSGQKAGLNLNDKGFASAPGYSRLPGPGTPSSADVFVCPQDCGHQWRRHFVADPIPDCPTHHVKLVPAPAGFSPIKQK